MMGTTQQNRLTIIAKKDMHLLPSNRPATNDDEFKEHAMFFPAGTVFINYGKSTSGDDCIEDGGLHGWCYIAGYSGNSPLVHYCNFHEYILNYWPEYPELFEEETT